MTEETRTRVTERLAELAAGHAAAVDELFAILYEELRGIAHRQRRRWRGDDTLHTTALVHEAFLKLVDQDRIAAGSREHFLGAAARIMRRVLIDHSRAMDAAKRGGRNADTRPVLQESAVVESANARLFALEEALRDLARHAPRQARVVKLRYLRGLTVSHIARALGLTARTVDRDSAAARIWLRRRLSA